MKTELFGGSEDGKPIELKGNIPLEILIPTIPGLGPRSHHPQPPHQVNGDTNMTTTREDAAAIARRERERA